MASPSTRHLTILLTDVKGFTEKTSQKSRAEILSMLEKHKEVVLPVLEGRGGKLVKTIGDAFLMTFDSPTDAVLAGVAVQDVLRAHNEGKAPGERIDIRVAINSGEVTLADNDVFGEPVNITARIESVAEAGEVFFTEAVYLAMNKTEVPSSEVGLLQLKGIPEKIRVYKVKRETPPGAATAALGAAAAAASSALPASLKAKLVSPEGGAGKTPSLGKRAGALLLDWIIVATVAGMFSYKVTGGRRPGRPARPAAAAAGTESPPVKVDVTGAKIDLTDGVKVDVPGLKVDIPKSVIDVEQLAAADEREREESRSYRRGESVIFSILWVLYQIVFLKRLGTTPGGRLFGLRVVRMDGAPLEKNDRQIRAVATLLSGTVVGLGFLWALWQKDGRGWHDIIADTRVVDAA